MCAVISHMLLETCLDPLVKVNIDRMVGMRGTDNSVLKFLEAGKAHRRIEKRFLDELEQALVTSATTAEEAAKQLADRGAKLNLAVVK